MTILKFPSSQPDADIKSDIFNKLYLGDWNFTCTKCHYKISFNPIGLIFKNIEFYCGSCGTFHKVSNPAFTSKT